LVPENPALQVHDPSKFACPWPLQVVAFEYWQLGPVKPGLHADALRGQSNAATRSRERTTHRRPTP
jgi:hypothetical protein